MDVERITLFLMQDDPALASDMAQRIFDAGASLTQMPDRARPGRVRNTREFLVQKTPYLIVFSRDDTINILRVLHSRQKWP
jgi:plasmid stabilization system protein ParE